MPTRRLTGTSSLQSAGTYPVGSYPQSLAVGDFNGDGRPDLVVANTGHIPGGGGSPSLSVLLNTGTDGGMTSVHANDCASAFSRIATLVKASQVGQTLDWSYILHEVKTTIDLVLFMERKRLTQIHYDPVEKWKLLRGLA